MLEKISSSVKEHRKEGKKMTEPIRPDLPMIAIVTITGNYCNLRCRYCFHHGKDQGSKQMMDSQLLKKFVKEYLEFPLETLTFSWHGGEPLLAGFSFFEKVLQFQEQFSKEGQRIRNLIQTNGTLINEEWASFFKKHNFGIGVSIDGNKESQNRFRIDNAGRGTFDKVIRGIEILRKQGVKAGVLQTVTRDSVPKAVENFHFFIKELGIKSFAVNTFYDVEGNNQEMLDQQVTNEEFTEFLKTYIDLWFIEDDVDLQIREIDNFLAVVLNKQAFTCEFNSLCWTTFCLNHDGKVYPCDRFLDQEEFLCGDLSKQSLLEIFNGSAWQEIVRRINTLPLECRVCKWGSVCYNGCSHLRVGGIEGKYYYCPTRKNIFMYLEKRLQEYSSEKGGETYNG